MDQRDGERADGRLSTGRFVAKFGASLDHIVGYRQHYAKLFEHLQHQYGDLDRDTIMAIIGFAAGGPVNMCERKLERLFVTCELSVYEEQMKGTEG